MPSQEEQEMKALMAARTVGIATVLFRNVLAQRQNLSLTESLCLTVLGLRGAATPTELAQVSGLSTGATTTLLDRLEARGLVHRRPNPQDRRGVIVETSEGFQKGSQADVVGIQKAQKSLAAHYTPEELAVIADFLNRYAENLKHEAQALTPGTPWPL